MVLFVSRFGLGMLLVDVMLRLAVRCLAGLVLALVGGL